MLAAAISGCATAPLAERALGKRFPIATDAVGEELAQVRFSADKKYESRGVPLSGDPLICGRHGVFRVNGASKKDRLLVDAYEEIAVTSVIQWASNGWEKTCWPFVAFTPEADTNYVVVNERVGGNGISFLWTGMAHQTCEVTVYRETQNGFERVLTRSASPSICQSKGR